MPNKEVQISTLVVLKTKLLWKQRIVLMDDLATKQTTITLHKKHKQNLKVTSFLMILIAFSEVKSTEEESLILIRSS